MLANATVGPSGILKVDVDERSGMIDSCLAITLVGKFFLEKGSSDFVLHYAELTQDRSIFFKGGLMMQLLDGDIVDCPIHPPPVRAPVQKDAMHKKIDQGMAAARTQPKAAPKRGFLRVKRPRAVVGAESSSSGTGMDSMSERSASSVSAPSSQDEEEVVAKAAPAARARGRQGALRWPVFNGHLLWNRSGSIDAACYICGATQDKTYHAFPRARQPHTLAFGRPMGASLLWLSLDCGGELDAHVSKYCDRDLPRNLRKAKRLEAMQAGWFPELFALERPARADESDGEPMAVPRRS